MPCHVPATSVSSRRHALYPKRPPTIAAKLDLSKPGERSAHDFLVRATSGCLPLFRVLSMNRRGSTLLLAIESAQGSPYVLSLSLEKTALSLRQWYPSHEAAKEAIATDAADRPTYVAFAQLLRERREQAGLSRHRLAELAKLSESTVRNLETARVIPLRQTLEILRAVEPLRLTLDDLPPWRDFGRSLRVGGLLVAPKDKPGPRNLASGEDRGQSHGQ